MPPGRPKKSKRGNPSCDVDPKLAKVCRRKQLRIQNQLKKSTECNPSNKYQGRDDDVNTQQETECEADKNEEERKKNISQMRREAEEFSGIMLKRKKIYKNKGRKRKKKVRNIRSS